MEILSKEQKKKKLPLLKSLKKMRTAAAFVLWLLAMALLVALFIAKKDEVKQNLEEAKVAERLFGKNEPLPLAREPAPLVARPNSDIGLQQQQPEAVSQEQIADSENSAEEQPVDVEMQPASLCFVKIDNDGNVSPAVVTREIEKSDSPMMAALNAVIAGANEAETEEGCQSLVPEGSELLGAVVMDGVATLDFNDAFEYNNFGFQGSFYQLMQIVYTATAFSTVDSVQILINGEKREYLGSEGVFIGSPLTRDSF